MTRAVRLSVKHLCSYMHSLVKSPYLPCLYNLHYAICINHKLKSGMLLSKFGPQRVFIVSQASFSGFQPFITRSALTVCSTLMPRILPMVWTLEKPSDVRYPFQSHKIHKITFTEQAFVWYRVDQAAVVAWQQNEPRPQSRSLQRWCSRCSSNAAQRKNATTPTDSWDTTNTYITS